MRGDPKIKRFFAALTLIVLLLSPIASFAEIIQQGRPASANQGRQDCWSKANCLSATNNCEPCFEKNNEACGPNEYGFCYARPVPTALTIPLGGLTEVNDPAQYISVFYEWGVSITGILAGIMIMIGGLLYLTAGGSPDRVLSAKNYISNALIGLILAMTSYLLLQTINPALLELKFPKVKLIQAVATIQQSAEQTCDSIDNPDLQVTPDQVGKTSCGDIGNIRSVSGLTAVDNPSCHYDICSNVEHVCLPCASEELCAKPANCMQVAGTRFDGWYFGELEEGKTRGAANQSFVNKCHTLKPKNQPPRLFEVFASSSCTLVSGEWKDAAVGALYYGAQALGASSIAGAMGEITERGAIQAGATSTRLGRLAGDATHSQTIRAIAEQAPGIALGTGIEMFINAGEAGKAAPKAIAITKEAADNFNKLGKAAGGAVKLIGVLVMATIGAVVGKSCGGVLEGTGLTCDLIDIRCDRIINCEGYSSVNVKGDRDDQNLETIPSIAGSLGERSTDVLEKLCETNPCQLPFKCTYVSQQGSYYPWSGHSEKNSSYTHPGSAWGSTAGACVTYNLSESNMSRCCMRDAQLPFIRNFPTNKKQQKGFLCETNEDCEVGLTCSGAPVEIKGAYEKCPGGKNSEPGCNQGIITSDCINTDCSNDAWYDSHSSWYKSTTKTYKRCQ